MHVSINMGEVLNPLAFHHGRSFWLEYKQEYRTRQGKSSVTHTVYEVGFLIRDMNYWYSADLRTLMKLATHRDTVHYGLTFEYTPPQHKDANHQQDTLKIILYNYILLINYFLYIYDHKT